MPDDGGFADLLKQTARNAGRRYAEIRESYREGRESSDPDATSADAAESADAADPDLSYLPRDDGGDARVVCRRYAEKRTVAVDDAGRPECFDADHPDCEGCVEDVRDGVVETW